MNCTDTFQFSSVYFCRSLHAFKDPKRAIEDGGSLGGFYCYLGVDTVGGKQLWRAPTASVAWVLLCPCCCY